MRASVDDLYEFSHGRSDKVSLDDRIHQTINKWKLQLQQLLGSTDLRIEQPCNGVQQMFLAIRIQGDVLKYLEPSRFRLDSSLVSENYFGLAKRLGYSTHVGIKHGGDLAVRILVCYHGRKERGDGFH